MDSVTGSPVHVRRGERGVVLILAIIVLVAMSLAALALMRSVLTGNRVAGNLAFQQSATLSADQGIETAVAWLELQRSSAVLNANANISTSGSGTTTSSTGGYFAARNDPTGGQSWDAWWATLTTTGINQLPQDAAGNTVYYVIHRLCAATGDPTNNNTGCQIGATSNLNAGGAKDSDPQVNGNPVQYYYRIIAHVTGARGTSSYVQAIVAM